MPHDWPLDEASDDDWDLLDPTNAQLLADAPETLWHPGEDGDAPEPEAGDFDLPREMRIGKLNWEDEP